MARKKERDPFRSIALGGIERHSWWVKQSAEQAAYYVKMLASRPEYETLAEEAMENAENALTDALQTVQETRARFAKLHKDGSGGHD